jgi:serine/threonine protein kinase
LPEQRAATPVADDSKHSFGSRIARAQVHPTTSMAEKLTRALMRHRLLGEPLPALGRYRIRRKLGEGGMAVVFEGWDPHLSRPVAIKVLHGDPDSSVVDIQHEARVLARLTDPTIVTVYDLGVEDEQVYVCMALVDGGDLSHWLRQHGPVPWRRILAWFADAARGLHTAHKANIVHRDFKLENLLIGSDGLARVTDFGLARLDPRADQPDADPAPGPAGADVPASPVTWTGLAGTPGYIAPEVRAGSRADARSDQWSFFVALDRALTFADDEPPPALAAMIERGRAEDPEDRYAELAIVEAMLRELLARPDTSARRPPILRSLADSPSPSPRTLATPPAGTMTPRPLAPPPLTGAGQIKGTTIARLRRWCEQRGPDTWRTALAKLEPEHARLAETALSVSWLPIAVYPQLLRASLEAGAEPSCAAAYELGRWASEHELGTIHRLLVRLLSPETVVERALSLWPRYYDTGRWTIDKQRTQVVAHLHDWAVVDELACAQLAGFVARLWEVAGRSKVVVRHTQCRCHGAPSCRFEVSWDGSLSGPG